MAQSYRVGGIAHNSFDINADGQYAYIAALNNSDQPQILRIPTNLEEDAALLYDPAAGTEINIMAGDYDAYFLWAAGNFGGNDKVVNTEDGIYWYVKNYSPFDYWYSSGGPLLVGPGDDQLVTIVINDSLALQESYFVGDSVYWLERHPNYFVAGAIDRLDSNKEEILLGATDAATKTHIEYSPDSGVQWGDVSDGLSTTPYNVTAIIFA